jgi:hypothetical protein
VPTAHVHSEPTHTWLAPHAVPHAPQLRGSAVVSTQPPTHETNGAAQAPTHAPAWQRAAFVSQSVPHAPQLSGSLASAAHALPQIWPACGHTQVPFVQVAAVGHALPQPPQLDTSDDVATHAEPHWVSPRAHGVWQAPFAHASPASHAWPHDPQLFASVSSATH